VRIRGRDGYSLSIHPTRYWRRRLICGRQVEKHIRGFPSCCRYRNRLCPLPQRPIRKSRRRRFLGLGCRKGKTREWVAREWEAVMCYVVYLWRCCVYCALGRGCCPRVVSWVMLSMCLILYIQFVLLFDGSRDVPRMCYLHLPFKTGSDSGRGKANGCRYRRGIDDTLECVYSLEVATLARV
jgi:hypothetical protein